MRRQFIEHTLWRTADQPPQTAGMRNGLLSMMQGPSFEGIFHPEFGKLCPPQALESQASPVAYLLDLLRWVQRIEDLDSADKDQRLPLHQRRQDLKPLSIDFNAVFQSVSAVDVIVKVLEKFVAVHGDAGGDVEEAMIQARYPNGLPYYQHWATIDTVARHHGMSVGNFAHRVDTHYPYFLQPSAWDEDAGRALAHASRLGPFQRQLLTEASPSFDDLEEREEFFALNFGTGGAGDFPTNLLQVPHFGERTKLDTPGLEALLSVRGFSPIRSVNVVYSGAPPEEVESERSGSVYLNANTAPAVAITGPEASFMHRLTLSMDNEADFLRFDRLNRKIRLDQWLGLPSDQVDALLAAAMRADGRPAKAKAEPEPEWWITPNVVNALGLFQTLRERYDCSAESFAAFINTFSIYGRGETPSQFDRIFNANSDYQQALILDDKPFNLLPDEGAADLTVLQICNALQIDLQTYFYLALAIANAQGGNDNTLRRNAPTLSAFFRLVKLPRMLGMTPVEGVLMLNVLGGKSWVDGLAGEPRIADEQGEGTPDVLNLIYALHSCVEWCSERNMPVVWMLSHVAPVQSVAETEADRQLFEQMRNLLGGALFTNAGLIVAGVPELPGADWRELLTELVDGDGLVLAYAGTQEDYLTFADAIFDAAVRGGLGEKDDAVVAGLVERMLGVLLQAREAQASLVKESLAVYTGLDAEQALLVLTWANATVHQLLRQVLEREGPVADNPAPGRSVDQDPLLTLLADVRNRSEVMAQLALSADVLRDYLDYGYRAWLQQDDPYTFTVHTLYYLSTLPKAFGLSRQAQQQLLDYLREVNALPFLAKDSDALRLAQDASAIRLAELFDWSAQEVRACVVHSGAEAQILKSLVQLDLLLRVRVLTLRTGMDAQTVLMVGLLPREINKPVYAETAERALLSLSETDAPVLGSRESLKDLVSVSCVADKQEVVANAANADGEMTFTVTLKDRDGKPLEGVKVYWRASLGTIEERETGKDGVVKAKYVAGKVMGTDTPLFWLDLFEPEYAPGINVIADAGSFLFPDNSFSPTPLGMVPYGEEVELYARVEDGYRNLAKNTLVVWHGESLDSREIVNIRPAVTRTNQAGVTRVFISSPTGGTFDISVHVDGKSEWEHFDLITFEGRPKNLNPSR
nr:Tc toxin subunit A [Pseudomonas sp. HMWF021]